MAGEPPDPSIRVCVAFAAPGREAIVEIELPTGATVADAIAASGLLNKAGHAAQTLQFAVHGRRVTPGTVVVDGDRVELTRPLQVDAKEARRARARLGAPAARTPEADDKA